MTEQPRRNLGFLYRQGGNLLFFGLQAVIVLGIVLLVVNINDDKPRLPKSHDASFGDEVLVIDSSFGCPTEEIYERWLNTVLEKATRLHWTRQCEEVANWSTATQPASSSR
jgi:hypothetical protein